MALAATGKTIPGGYVFLYCAEKGANPLNAQPVQAGASGAWTCDFAAVDYAQAPPFTAKVEDAADNGSPLSASVPIAPSSPPRRSLASRPTPARAPPTASDASPT